MAFKSLSTFLDDLPFVLAGPVLRQVTPKSVTVWLVLRVEADVTLVVLDPEPADSKPLRGKRRTIAIGKNLHMVAVTATLQEGFDPLTEGVIYRYDMEFEFPSGIPSLSLALATQMKVKLDYENLQLPSFCLPPTDINTLRLIHGSCRIPHGGGPDALAILDGLIAQTATNPVARPHQLILSGDQIYADDVAASMIVMLSDAADVLLGWQESLPVNSALGGPLVGNKLAPFFRRQVLEDIGFPSEDLDAHLMTLGEYLCMYLFVWSDVLWNDSTIASVSDVLASVLRNTDPQESPGWKLTVALNKERINSHIRNLKTLRKSLPDVRRVLANIPSYMIFDDHEVTDDWNMTREVCKLLYGNSLGLQICQNALVAYAVCQHWGNDPTQFEDTLTNLPPGTELLRLLNGGDEVSYAANVSNFRRLVAVHDFKKLKDRPNHSLFHDPDSLIYNYTVEGPGHQVIVTDTRSWRSFPRKGGGDFLSANQMKAQIANAPPTNGRALLVVLSTNAPPIQPIRSATKRPWLVDAIKHFPDLFESWELPAPSTERLYNAISDKLPTLGSERHGPAILLSGDVHMSFSSRLLFKGKARYGDPPDKPKPVTVVLAQFVASSLRKQTGATIDFHREGYNHAPFGTKWLIARHAPEHYVGWNLPTGQRKTIGEFTITRDNGIVTKKKSKKIRGPTTLLTKENRNGEIYLLRVSVDPDYTYRLDYLKASDQGELAITPAPIPATPTGTAADREKAAEAFNKATGNYRVYNSASTTKQQIVGLNNLGEITFVWDESDAKTAIHTLRWLRPKTERIMFTTYFVNLDPNDPEFPEVIERLP